MFRLYTLNLKLPFERTDVLRFIITYVKYLIDRNTKINYNDIKDTVLVYTIKEVLFVRFNLITSISIASFLLLIAFYLGFRYNDSFLFITIMFGILGGLLAYLIVNYIQLQRFNKVVTAIYNLYDTSVREHYVFSTQDIKLKQYIFDSLIDYLVDVYRNKEKVVPTKAYYLGLLDKYAGYYEYLHKEGYSD